jgi:hypothetical protein
MIPAEVIALLINIAAHSPELAAQTAKLWADTAHGEGGVQKVSKVLGDLAGLFTTTAAATGAPAAPVYTGNAQVTG